MATNIKLNLGDDANQSLTISPDGAEIRVKLWWQPSDEHWYVHVDALAAINSYRNSVIVSWSRARFWSPLRLITFISQVVR